MPAIADAPGGTVGKGKGKQGKNLGNEDGRRNEERPDSVLARQKCWKFSKGICKDRNCRRIHICTICGATDHGAKACPNGKGKGKGKAHGAAGF